jgi:hypothetical protein
MRFMVEQYNPSFRWDLRWGKLIPLAKAQSCEEQQKPGTSWREGDTKDIYARAKQLLGLKLIGFLLIGRKKRRMPKSMVILMILT